MAKDRKKTKTKGKDGASSPRERSPRAFEHKFNRMLQNSGEETQEVIPLERLPRAADLRDFIDQWLPHLEDTFRLLHAETQSHRGGLPPTPRALTFARPEGHTRWTYADVHLMSPGNVLGIDHLRRAMDALTAEWKDDALVVWVYPSDSSVNIGTYYVRLDAENEVWLMVKRESKVPPQEICNPQTIARLADLLFDRHREEIDDVREFWSSRTYRGSEEQRERINELLRRMGVSEELLPQACDALADLIFDDDATLETMLDCAREESNRAMIEAQRLAGALLGRDEEYKEKIEAVRNDAAATRERERKRQRKESETAAMVAGALRKRSQELTKQLQAAQSQIRSLQSNAGPDASQRTAALHGAFGKLFAQAAAV